MSVCSLSTAASASPRARIVRDLEDVRRLKEEPGKDMHAVGGATLVSSLMDAGLVDEIRLVVQPIVLGGGKPLFKDVKERHALTLLEARPLKQVRSG
jgi:dihydrofolate reductase